MTGKSKIVPAPSLVETFPNIIQQFEICLCDTHRFNKQKYLTLCFLSFLKKYSLTPCLKLLRLFDNFKHVGKLFLTVGVKQDNVFWAEHVLLDGCFSFKTEDLVFI